MSSGDLAIDGNRAHYELRMPAYELPHVTAPETTLFDHIRFDGARLVSKSCRLSLSEYLCAADYEFPAPVDLLEVECTFPSVTVPNHVHLLRATNGSKRDQAIFDLSFPKATLRFRPPTAGELAFTQFGAGFLRALGGLVQVLFLASLALAARSRRELVSLAGMFIFGQAVSAVVAPAAGWQPAARFVEAAAALSLAYLAVEILLLPDAGWRWAIAGVLGAFHGLYFELFLQTTGYNPAWVLSGAAVADLLAIAVFALIFSRIRRIPQFSAPLLLVVGMVWFFLRLRGQ